MFVYIPATIRNGYHQLYSSQTNSSEVGFCGLPAREAQVLRRGAERVQALGPRAVAELLLELADKRADRPELLRTLATWTERLSPTAVNVAGGDRFPPKPVREVVR